jgi:hypothetical protein
MFMYCSLFMFIVYVTLPPGISPIAVGINNNKIIIIRAGTVQSAQRLRQGLNDNGIEVQLPS